MSKNQLYLLYGNEDFLISGKLEQLLLEYKTKNLVKLSSSITLKELYSQVISNDLFVQEKILVIKNPEFLKAKSEEEISLLNKISVQLKLGEDLLILAIFDNAIDFRTKIPQLLKKEANLFELNGFKDWEQEKIIWWIKDKIKSQGKKITEEAALALEACHGNNLKALASEIEKLVTFKIESDEITLADIKAVTLSESYTSFDLNLALQQKNLKQAIRITYNLMKNNEDPIKLLGLIASNIRLYYQILLLLNEKKSIDQIATVLGKNLYYLKRLVPEVRKNFQIVDLEKAFQVLQQKDFEIKSGQLKPEISLLLAVNQIF
ncbi:MAG: DNA polymerase III subunit delta [Candidatus Margulisiibacteriota bacterium]|jgi:DNA polymerase-3 subunit delta